MCVRNNYFKIQRTKFSEMYLRMGEKNSHKNINKLREETRCRKFIATSLQTFLKNPVVEFFLNLHKTHLRQCRQNAAAPTGQVYRNSLKYR